MKFQKQREMGKIRKYSCIIMLVLIVFSIIPLRAAASGEKVIRVGYDSNSHFIKESGGIYYGYGVEYLEKIAEYTGWKYEYIKDDSWHDSLDKLRSGEIDLICTAHYTEQRAAEFLYSEYPFGYETSLLYAWADSEISYQDYTSMQGKKIGLLRESYSASDFERYAEEEKIVFESIYFDRQNDMKTALENGQVEDRKSVV